MSPRVQQILGQTADLSKEERAELAILLLDADDSPTDPEYAEAWANEIQRRIAEWERGEVKPIPWSQARLLILSDGPRHGG